MNEFSTSGGSVGVGWLVALVVLAVVQILLAAFAIGLLHDLGQMVAKLGRRLHRLESSARPAGTSDSSVEDAPK